MHGSKDFWVMVSNVYIVENGAMGGGEEEWFIFASGNKRIKILNLASILEQSKSTAELFLPNALW